MTLDLLRKTKRASDELGCQVRLHAAQSLREIAFLDRSGGGTHVRIAFDLARLALLAEVAEQPQDEEPA